MRNSNHTIAEAIRERGELGPVVARLFCEDDQTGLGVVRRDPDFGLVLRGQDGQKHGVNARIEIVQRRRAGEGRVPQTVGTYTIHLDAFRGVATEASELSFICPKCGRSRRIHAPYLIVAGDGFEQRRRAQKFFVGELYTPTRSVVLP